MAQDKPVTLAAITGAHGVTGEVRLKLFGEGVAALSRYSSFNDGALTLRKLRDDAKGGAILLGLRGVVLIGHGATSVEAVKNGTLAAAEAVRAGLVENVANSMDGIVL